MTAPSWAGPYRTVDGQDEVLVPCDSCGGPVFESCRTRWRSRSQGDCGLFCEPPADVAAGQVHWVPQGVVGGAEVVTSAEYVAIAGPLDPEFDWPVPVASRDGRPLYLRPPSPRP